MSTDDRTININAIVADLTKRDHAAIILADPDGGYVVVHADPNGIASIKERETLDEARHLARTYATTFNGIVIDAT